MSGGAFVGEAEAYGILQRSGILPPRHAFATDPAPFSPGDPVVLKGLGEGLWHKSELGAVAFIGYEKAAVDRSAEAMRGRVEGAGHRWIGALVCEKIAFARSEGLPSEAFVSLTRNETGWIALFGCGGLQAEALSQHAGVLRWPIGLMSPAQALAEVREHLVGRVWLGRLRGAKALTDEVRLGAFLTGLWRLAGLAEEEGLTLLEMNPVALDLRGDARPLDAVGRRDPRPPARIPPPAGFLDAVRAPRRVALAGISSREDGVGRIILENLRRCAALEGGLTLIKPGQDILLGLPCVASVAALRNRPVDLLILAIPAPAAAKAVSELIAQGGGAQVVALVPGGLGDGADTEGLGAALAAELRSTRAAGRWTPAILGPNFLGHWVPGIDLDTSFIPQEKLPPMHPEGGSLALLGQSGAFLLCRRSRHRHLRLLLGAALGNELDVALPDYLEGLASDPRCRAVAAYAEGFRPGNLDATLYAAMRLRERGVPFLLHRAGRTAAGQAAAASHTGAMAGEVDVELAVLSRAGVRFSDSIAALTQPCPGLPPTRRFRTARWRS